MSRFIATVVAIGTFIGLILGVIMLLFPSHRTKQILERVVIDARINDSIECDLADGWGNPIIIKRNPQKDKIEYTAISGGGDGVMGTEDDMSCTKVNVNWSRSFGKALSKSIKETAKGFWDGAKESTIFSEKETNNSKKEN